MSSKREAMSEAGALWEGGKRGSIDRSEKLVNEASLESVGSTCEGREGVASIRSGYFDLCVCKL